MVDIMIDTKFPIRLEEDTRVFVKSQSSIIGLRGENTFCKFAICVDCDDKFFGKLTSGTAVNDVRCAGCGKLIQVKTGSTPFSSGLLNLGQWDTILNSVTTSVNPPICMIEYNKEDEYVRTISWINALDVQANMLVFRQTKPKKRSRAHSFADLDLGLVKKQIIYLRK